MAFAGQAQTCDHEKIELTLVLVRIVPSAYPAKFVACVKVMVIRSPTLPKSNLFGLDHKITVSYNKLQCTFPISPPPELPYLLQLGNLHLGNNKI